MEFSQYTDRLNEFTGQKDTEWNIFLREFRKTNPEPVMGEVEKKSVTKRPVQLDIKFWLALAAGLGALALSGFRVAERFFAVAGGYKEGVNPIFSYGEAVAAVLAVNITIFALAIAYAYTTEKMSEGSQTWGLGTAVVISAVAGLGQAFNGLGSNWVGLVSGFDLILAFVLGIGATALEYFSGDLLGVEIVRYKAELETERTRYETETERSKTEHTEQYRSAYAEYAEQHKAWVRLAKQQFPNWMSQFAKWNEQAERDRTKLVIAEQFAKWNEQTEQPGRTVRSREGTFSELVRHVLSDVLSSENRVLSFGELSDKVTERLLMQGVSEQDATELVRKKKSQVSELRTAWVREQNL